MCKYKYNIKLHISLCISICKHLGQVANLLRDMPQVMPVKVR